MKAITTTFQFNKVCVIQSLATDEPQTGERLVNDRLRPALTPMGFRTSYVKVADTENVLREMYRAVVRRTTGKRVKTQGFSRGHTVDMERTKGWLADMLAGDGK